MSYTSGTGPRCCDCGAGLAGQYYAFTARGPQCTACLKKAQTNAPGYTVPITIAANVIPQDVKCQGCGQIFTIKAAPGQQVLFTCGPCVNKLAQPIPLPLPVAPVTQYAGTKTRIAESAPLICEFCWYHSGDIVAIDLHLLEQHKDKLTPEILERINAEPRMANVTKIGECPHCGLQFDNLGALKRHVETVHKEAATEEENLLIDLEGSSDTISDLQLDKFIDEPERYKNWFLEVARELRKMRRHPGEHSPRFYMPPPFEGVPIEMDQDRAINTLLDEMEKIEGESAYHKSVIGTARNLMVRTLKETRRLKADLLRGNQVVFKPAPNLNAFDGPPPQPISDPHTYDAHVPPVTWPKDENT